MNIIFNDQLVNISLPVTIDELLHQMQLHQPGIAIAINQHILPQDNWKTRYLQEGDRILLFQAIAGG